MSAILALLGTQLGRSLAAGGAIVLALALAWWWVNDHAFSRGYATAINAIAAQNKEAVDAADAARARVHACRDSGGVWAIETGQCNHG